MITISLLFLPVVLFSQDIKQDLKKMNLVYAKASSYSMKLKVEALHRGGSSTISSQKGEVKYSDGKYYSSYNGITTVLNKKYFVSVDDNHKTVVVNDAVKKKKASTETDIEAMIDKLLDMDTEKMKYLKRNGDVIKIEIKMQGPYYSKMTVTLDASTHYLKQVVYYVKDESYPYDRIRISYSDIKVDQKIANRVFSEKQFLRSKGKSFVLSEKYATYQLIDQTDITLKTD